MLLPAACAVCLAPGPSPCARCRAALRPPPLLAAPPGIDAVHALLSYEGAGRELVARLKYRNARAALPWLADGLAAVVAAAGTGAVAVTWIPTTARRRRERGFDQGRLIAGAVARRLHLPCRNLLVRAPGPAQTDRHGADRRSGPVLSGLAPWRMPRTVLLVDDVLTTGASASAAATVLRASRCVSVDLAVLARTPLKPVPRRSESSC